MIDREAESAALWSARAAAFRESPSHAGGRDLDVLVAWCAPQAGRTALDVATGGGHVARRLAVAGCVVTTTDAASGMEPDVVCAAERLPFADISFDVVVCRLAAHHFRDVARAVREMARVARQAVVIEDGLFLSEAAEQAEVLRDPTQVRHLARSEWRQVVEATGLRIDRLCQVERLHRMAEWLALTGCRGPVAERVRGLLADRTYADGAWVDEAIVIRAVRQAPASAGG